MPSTKLSKAKLEISDVDKRGVLFGFFPRIIKTTLHNTSRRTSKSYGTCLPLPLERLLKSVRQAVNKESSTGRASDPITNSTVYNLNMMMSRLIRRLESRVIFCIMTADHYAI